MAVASERGGEDARIVTGERGWIKLGSVLTRIENSTPGNLRVRIASGLEREGLE
jgi:hypothetical protein